MSTVTMDSCAIFPFRVALFLKIQFLTKAPLLRIMAPPFSSGGLIAFCMITPSIMQGI